MCLGDYDNDGWPDLFVVNYDYGQNDYLYHNNGDGTFTRIFTGPEVNDGLWGTGCAWGDYDNDGKLDLFVANTTQGGRLYHNDGNGNFSLSNSSPSTDPGYEMAASWCDYDNDGFLDLFVTNYNNSGNYLYKNNGNGTFTRVTNEIVTNDFNTSVGCAWGDYNNDGKVDLFVANSGSPNLVNYLYKNVGAPGNFLICKLHGCMPLPGNSNKFGIGSKIKIYSGNFFEMREVTAGHGIGCEDMIWQQFGLGNRTNIDSLVVYWPSGKIEKLTNVAVNQIITVDECLVGIENNQIPVRYELYQNYPNPFNPTTTIEYSLIKGGNVRLKVFDMMGKEVKTLVDGYEGAGNHKIDFNASNISSGMYIYKLESGEFTDSKKMILIK